MAITFKYGAPGPILQAGFAAGVGNRQKRQQEDALEIWQQQNQQQFQAGQAAINRRFQYGMQEQQFGNQLELQALRFQEQGLQDREQRAFQAEQAGLGRDFQSGQTKALIDARSAESGRDREHDLALAGRRESFLRDQATQEGLRSGELELPPEAQNRLRQLESGRVEAMKLDPVQKQEFMEQYEREKSTLMGLAQPAKTLPIGDQFDKTTIEKNGTLYQRGKDGSFDVLREPPEDTSQADKEKYAKLLQAEAIRLAKDAEDTEGDLGSYIEQAKKNLAGVGFAEPQRQAQPTPNLQEMAAEFPGAVGTQNSPPQLSPAQVQQLAGLAGQQLPSEPPLTIKEKLQSVGGQYYVGDLHTIKDGPQHSTSAAPQQPAAGGKAQAQQTPMPNDKPDAPWDENTPLSIPDASNRQLLEMAKTGSPGNASMAKEELEARGVTQAPGKAPLNVAELDKQSQAVAASMLTQPKSKADYDALEKGTMFIAPDGSVRRK